ncbi:MAG TPA: hypothetical protein VHE35_15510 [Kofleriaceae bacterium]|nr:hypothetical protein [Kofleriaceae bacterium]
MTAEIVSIAVAAPTGAYGKELGPATRFVDDAAAHLREVATLLDARLTELAGPAATCAAVSDAIRGAAERLRSVPEGLFVLSYAGHGGRVRDVSGDEADGYDEAWALDDAPFIDDTLTELLAGFHHDIHVVLISNCCYSAGMLDGIDAAAAAAPAPAPAGPVVFPDAVRLPPAPARWPEASSDGIPAPAVRAAMIAAEAPEILGTAAVPPGVGTNRVVIASCGDHQLMILPDCSRLTMRVLDAVFPADGAARRRAATDYAAVEALVAGLASVSQTPVVLASGPDLQRPAFVPQPLVRR